MSPFMGLIMHRREGTVHCRAEMQEGNFCWDLWETGPQVNGFSVHIGRLDTRHSGSQPRLKPPPMGPRAAEMPTFKGPCGSDSEGNRDIHDRLKVP